MGCLQHLLALRDWRFRLLLIITLNIKLNYAHFHLGFTMNSIPVHINLIQHVMSLHASNMLQIQSIYRSATVGYTDLVTRSSKLWTIPPYRPIRLHP
jgi:hypothetical protein